jgi:hypothetical protein
VMEWSSRRCWAGRSRVKGGYPRRGARGRRRQMNRGVTSAVATVTPEVLQFTYRIVELVFVSSYIQSRV